MKQNKTIFTETFSKLDSLALNEEEFYLNDEEDQILMHDEPVSGEVVQPIVDPELGFEDERDLESEEKRSYIGKKVCLCNICMQPSFDEITEESVFICPVCGTEDDYTIVGVIVPEAEAEEILNGEDSENIDQEDVIEEPSEEDEEITESVKSKKYYLGSKEKFEKFTKGDIGFHFGTKQQALSNIDNDGYLYTVKLDYNKPLKMNDVDFNSSSALIKALYSNLIIDNEEYEELKKKHTSTALTYDSALSKVLRDKLNAEGYDSITYEDISKGNGKSIIILNPSNITILDTKEINGEDLEESKEQKSNSINESEITVKTDDAEVNINIDEEDSELEVEDVITQDDEDIIEYEFNESKFNTLVHKFLTDNYKNIKSFNVLEGKISDVRDSRKRIKLEGVITFTNGEVKPISFITESFDITKENSKVRMSSPAFGKSRSFMLESTISNNNIEPTRLNYRFRTMQEGKAYEVYGKALLEDIQ